MSLEKLLGLHKKARLAQDLLGCVRGLDADADRGLAVLQQLDNDLAAWIESAKRAEESRRRNLGAVEKVGGTDQRRCPLCGHSMEARHRRGDVSFDGWFWGCTQYPGCMHTAPLSLAEFRQLQREGIV